MYPVKHASVNAAADGVNEIIAAIAGKSIVVLGYTLTCTVSSPSQALKGNFEDGAGTPVVHGVFFASDLAFPAPLSYVGNWEAPAFEVAIGEPLNIRNGTGVDTVGHITYMLR